MKTTSSKLIYVLFLFIFAGLIGCKGDKGDMGPAGTNGTNGTNGIDGTDGTNGNANVTTLSLLSTDITWTAGTYFGRTTNTFVMTESAVNTDIIDHGTVLGYCREGEDWYALPFTWENSAGTSRQYVFHSYSLNTITLYAYQTAGVLNPSALVEYRFLLITDNTVTKGASSQQDILNSLSKANVNVNNYYEVMDYFGKPY